MPAQRASAPSGPTTPLLHARIRRRKIISGGGKVPLGAHAMRAAHARTHWYALLLVCAAALVCGWLVALSQRSPFQPQDPTWLTVKGMAQVQPGWAGLGNVVDEKLFNDNILNEQLVLSQNKLAQWKIMLNRIPKKIVEYDRRAVLLKKIYQWSMDKFGYCGGISVDFCNSDELTAGCCRLSGNSATITGNFQEKMKQDILALTDAAGEFDIIRYQLDGTGITRTVSRNKGNIPKLEGNFIKELNDAIVNSSKDRSFQRYSELVRATNRPFDNETAYIVLVMDFGAKWMARTPIPAILMDEQVENSLIDGKTTIEDYLNKYNIADF